jgi:hypothetical protein
MYLQVCHVFAYFCKYVMWESLVNAYLQEISLQYKVFHDFEGDYIFWRLSHIAYVHDVFI